MEMKQKLMSGVATGALLLSMCPALALAATPSTDVTLEADSSSAQMAVTVPETLAFSVNADGSFTTPDATSAKIQNNSVFPVHVSNIAVTPQSGFNMVTQSNFASASTDDTLWTSLQPNEGTAIQLADYASGKAPTAGEWNMAKSGATGADIELTSAGAIKNITKDLSTAQKAFDVAWSIEAGSAN